MNEDLLTKAKQAESPEALVSLAKENGIELTDEKAAELFSQFHQCGELSDNELSNVSGGAVCTTFPQRMLSSLRERFPSARSAAMTRILASGPKQPSFGFVPIKTAPTFLSNKIDARSAKPTVRML